MGNPIKSRNTQKQLPLLMFTFSFLFFAFLMWCAPYSSDDLEFAALNYGSPEEYLTYVLQYGNGRVLGNISAILMAHSRVICILAKAFLLASSVVMIPAILNIHSVCGYLVTFVLFVMIDPSVFGEVYVWTSGFSNYFPPIWMTLVIVSALKAYPSVRSRTVRLLICAGIFLLGTAGQLFIEHSSGVNLLLALCFTVICLRKDKKNAAPCAVWLTAAIAGLAVMLLVPRIFYIQGNHTETYRSVHLGGIAELIYSCAKNVVQLCGHYFGVCLLPVCFGAVSTVFLTRERRSEKANKVLFSLSAISVLYLLVSLFLTAADYLGKSALIQHSVDCVFTVLPLGVWIAAAFGLEPELRKKMLFCLAFALISIAPLLVVTPIPTRVIYQSYVFILLAALLCFAEIQGRLGEKALGYVQSTAGAVCVLMVLVIGSVFLSVHNMAEIRDRHIRQEIANGATEIVIFQLPYEYTTWDHLWSQKYSYGVDDSVTFAIEEFDEWMHSIYN